MLIHIIINFFIGTCIFYFAINAMIGTIYMKLLFIMLYIIYLIGCRIIFKKMIDKIGKDDLEKFYVKNVKSGAVLNMEYDYEHKLIITSSKPNEYKWFNRYDFEKLIDKYIDYVLYWDIINYFNPLKFVYNI